MCVDDEAFESDSFQAEDDDFVPAFFARDQEEAEVYCELLADHDIPARAGPEGAPPEDKDDEHELAGRRGMTHGVPVLVPEALLDEASEVIADREDIGDFEEEEKKDEDEEDEEEGFGLEEVDDEDDDALFDEDDEDDEDLDDLDDDDEEEEEDDEFL